ncbi:MAG: HAD family hydrolase [Candidatus Hodarchaeota archaeon]
MDIKGIIFDFGFTLYYFEDVSLEKYFECFRKGLMKSIEFLKENNIISNDQAIIAKFIELFKKRRMNFFRKSIKTKDEYPTAFIFQNVLEQLVNENYIDEIANLDENMYKELADLYHSTEEKEWKPFQETKSTLENILELRDIRIAVLSNHPHHSSIKSMLKKHDLFDFFDAVVTSAKFGKRKPHSDIFYYTLKKMGLEIADANYCLMCGDEYADIIGGHRAGLKTIFFQREYKFPHEKEIILPNLIKVKNISEILNFIS